MIKVEWKYISSGKVLNHKGLDFSETQASAIEYLQTQLQHKLVEKLEPLKDEIRNNNVKIVIPFNSVNDFNRTLLYSVDGASEELEFKIKSILGSPDE